jgi:hypothetical protein
MSAMASSATIIIRNVDSVVTAGDFLDAGAVLVGGRSGATVIGRGGQQSQARRTDRSEIFKVLAACACDSPATLWPA